MRALLLVFLTGCGVFGLENRGWLSPADTGEPSDTTRDDPPVEVALSDRSWESDLDAATVNAPEGLDAFLVLMDSTLILFHVDREAGSELDLIIALTDADGHQDPCQPVLDLAGADFADNPWVEVDMAELPMRINGEDVVLRDVSFEMKVETYGEGFTQGWLQAEIDGRELDEALGDRISSTTCELLEAMGTECHACDDGSPSCFALDIEGLNGVDYGGAFDPDPDPGECQ